MSTAAANLPDTIFLELSAAGFTRFNGPALTNITWTIKTGETWAITSPAGSGKTTLAEALAGKHRLVSGKVTYRFLPNSEAYWQLKNYVSFISFQPQQRELDYGHFYYQQRYNSSDTEGITTVMEYLTRTTAAAAPAQMVWDEVIQLLNLTELLPLEVIKLSNGQTRKMLIAQALLRQPRLLILDNAFTGLDQQARQDFKNLIKQLIQQGTQVVLVTSPNDIPESVTHVLALDNFAIAGSYTRSKFLQKQWPQEQKTTNTETTTAASTLFTHQTIPDFAIAVKFEATTIRYDQKVILDNINWTICQGEKWALAGPNGSGKTTLLSLINGDNPQAFANKITLFDRRKGSGESIWDIKKRIGFVSPELHLYFRQNLPAATVAATGFFDTLFPKRRLTAAEAQLVNNFFGFYGITALQNKSFLQLSASEQRLVLIIRSLLKNPEMLIWDEPYQGLNDALIQKTQELLTTYATPTKTIIFVSHYPKEIPTWINQCIYLEEGRIKELVK